jgi:hypothetical protein
MKQDNENLLIECVGYMQPLCTPCNHGERGTKERTEKNNKDGAYPQVMEGVNASARAAIECICGGCGRCGSSNGRGHGWGGTVVADADPSNPLNQRPVVTGRVLVFPKASGG